MSLTYDSNRENDLSLLLDNAYNAVVRCVGFLYLRFVTPQADMISVFKDYLLDDMELVYVQNGKCSDYHRGVRGVFAAAG